MERIMKRALSRGMIVAALAAGVSTFGTPAVAKPGFAIVALSPAQFLSNCQSMGGTHSMAPYGGIRCTLPSGTVVDCSFGSDGQAICSWNRTMPTKSQKDLLGDPLPTTMDPSTGKPKLPTTDVAPGTVN
jgi:hypothetical protein